LLKGTGQGRDIFFYYRGPRLFAVRKGPFKAHYVTQPGYGKDKAEEHNPPILYHLEHDPGERFDVAKDHPALLAEIAREVERHKAKMIPGKPQLEAIIPKRE
jgi:arylsulfatase